MYYLTSYTTSSTYWWVSLEDWKAENGQRETPHTVDKCYTDWIPFKANLVINVLQ